LSDLKDSTASSRDIGLTALDLGAGTTSAETTARFTTRERVSIARGTNETGWIKGEGCKVLPFVDIEGLAIGEGDKLSGSDSLKNGSFDSSDEEGEVVASQCGLGGGNGSGDLSIGGGMTVGDDQNDFRGKGTAI
jgi:hypothetical protein